MYKFYLFRNGPLEITNIQFFQVNFRVINQYFRNIELDKQLFVKGVFKLLQSMKHFGLNEEIMR